ncbi:MAG: class I SAM-dependent rRNA methyltransferase [Myxococcales bacterium]|nr:class I SAM-dependent rRNA methyltransferase [Myxococcales bacterium]
MQAEATLTLARPLERALRDGHPWVYRDAVRGSASAGSVATLVDARGSFVARGLADDSVIALRVFTTRDESVSEPLLRARVEEAALLRDAVISSDTNAYRLVHGEGDRLPGFVVDVYGPIAVLKTDGAGAFAWRDRFASAIEPVLKARGITALLRRASNAGVASRDGDEKAELVWGSLGDRDDSRRGRVVVREHGMALVGDLLSGQKTGLFLDQREARKLVRSIARDRRVLNLYSYTGGFSVAAGLGGARAVESVDIAQGAIDLARESWAANALDEGLHQAHCEDVWKFLANKGKARARYDLVIADPPSFAPRADSVPKALDAYKQLHASSLALVAHGGFYLAGSCSSHVTREMFFETLREGARRAKRSLQLIEAKGAPADHPRLLAFSEGDYLKADLYRVE